MIVCHKLSEFIPCVSDFNCYVIKMLFRSADLAKRTTLTVLRIRVFVEISAEWRILYKN